VRCTVVLDGSAIRSYARLDDVAVGELIATVHEDGDLIGIPVLALLDVWTDLTEAECAIVTDLVQRESSPVELLPVEVAAIPTVAGLRPSLGYGGAHAVAAVLSLGATVATYAPRAYAGHLDLYDVLELS
jgi:hypothetical protein